MNVTQWTPEAVATLVRMAEGGAKAADIARELNLTRSAVIGKASRAGVKLLYRTPPAAAKPKRPRRSRRRKYLDAEVQKLRDLYLAGETYQAMERLTGIPTANFGYMLRDVPKRRPDSGCDRRYDDAFKVAAVASILTGESYDRAGKRLGVTHRSIWVWKQRPEILAHATALAERIKAAFAAEQERQRLAAEAAAEAESVRIATLNAPVMAQMGERHRAICQRRVDGDTLEAIGNDYGITRERVRQIEARWRLLGLVVPGARPLSEAARNTPGIRLPTGAPRGRKPKPPKPRGPDKRRREHLDPAIRQARSDRMRAMWAAAREARA